MSKVAIIGMSNYIDRLITAESLDNYGVKSHQCQAAIIMSMIFLGLTFNVRQYRPVIVSVVLCNHQKVFGALFTS